MISGVLEYEDVTANSGILHGAYGMGACAGDYDNDGWIDLYVTNVRRLAQGIEDGIAAGEV